MSKVQPPFKVGIVPIPAKGYLQGTNIGIAYNKGYEDGDLEGSYRESQKHQAKMKMVDEALKLLDESMQEGSLARRILLAIRGVCMKCGENKELNLESALCDGCEAE